MTEPAATFCSCPVGTRFALANDPDGYAALTEALRASQEQRPGAESFNSIHKRTGIRKPTLKDHRERCLGLSAPAEEATEATSDPGSSHPDPPSDPSANRPDPAPRPTPASATSSPLPATLPVTTRPGPGRRCTVCDHPQRQAIDEALVGASVSFRTIAQQFDVDHTAAWRHAHNHVPALLALARDESREEAASSLAALLPGIIADAQEMVTEAKAILHAATTGDAKDHGLAVKAIRAANDGIAKLTHAAELLGKRTGELQSDSQNVLLLVQQSSVAQEYVAAIARKTYELLEGDAEKTAAFTLWMQGQAAVAPEPTVAALPRGRR